MSALYEEKVREGWHKQNDKYNPFYYLQKEGYNVIMKVDPVTEMILLLVQNPNEKIIKGYALKNKNLNEEQEKIESKLCKLIKEKEK